MISYRSFYDLFFFFSFHGAVHGVLELLLLNYTKRSGYSTFFHGSKRLLHGFLVCFSWILKSYQWILWQFFMKRFISFILISCLLIEENKGLWSLRVFFHENWKKIKKFYKMVKFENLSKISSTIITKKNPLKIKTKYFLQDLRQMFYCIVSFATRNI